MQTALTQKLTIHVETLTNTTITLEQLEPSETISNVKAKIRERDPKLSDFALTFAGGQLEDGHTLASQNITNDATLRLVPCPILQ